MKTWNRCPDCKDNRPCLPCLRKISMEQIESGLYIKTGRGWTRRREKPVGGSEREMRNWRSWRRRNETEEEKSRRHRTISCTHHDPVIRGVLVTRALRRKGYLPPIKECDCFVCGKRAAHYHHVDYTKPHEVIPVCHKCHKSWHTHNNPKGRSLRYTEAFTFVVPI